jgi:lactoylglutathione lyase
MNSRKSWYIPIAPLHACGAEAGYQAARLVVRRGSSLCFAIPISQEGRTLMAKLRHIALIVPDPEKAAKFFEEAFDMKVAGKARRGLYVSDGTVNVALLKQEGDEKVGIYHFGMWVDDLDEAEKKVVDAGGKYLAGRPEPSAAGQTAHSYYEAKYKDPLGIVFDLTHTGWIGAVKDVAPAKN